jgi:hypothetical protein
MILFWISDHCPNLNVLDCAESEPANSAESAMAAMNDKNLFIVVSKLQTTNLENFIPLCPHYLKNYEDSICNRK